MQPDLLRDAALAGNSAAVTFLCEAFNNATQIPLTAGTPGFVHPDLRGAAYIAGVAQPPGCNVIQSEQLATWENCLRSFAGIVWLFSDFVAILTWPASVHGSVLNRIAHVLSASSEMQTPEATHGPRCIPVLLLP